MNKNLQMSNSDDCDCRECSDRREREYWIEKERIDSEAFKKLVADNTDLFKAIWHWGDGNGGYVLGSIREAVTGSFFNLGKPKDPNVYQKKPIPNSIRKKVFERDEYRCRHCNTHLNLTIDHIKPEVLGGTLNIDNLQTLCKSCNSKKGWKPKS